MANTQVATITFHGQQLITAKNGDQIVVAMKPIVENIGLDWRSQYLRIKRHPIMSKGMVIMTMPSSSGDQDTSMLPLKMLNGWLFGIEANRVRPEIRDKVIQYQEECFDALYSYWNAGVAINPRLPITPEMQSALQAIVATISPDGKQRGMIWARFNRHFKIAKYNQLPCSQIEEAKQYLVETFLNGEYIEQDELDMLNMKAYVAATSRSLVDIKAELKRGLSNPTVPLTDQVQKAVNAKAFELASEYRAALQDHLECRIAYTCEQGNPRYLNETQALKIVDSTTLDSSLTHHFYGLLENVHSMAQSLTMMTDAYKRDVGKALGKPQLLAA